MWDKLERKLGKYAVPHLINYLIIGYGIGYVLSFLSSVTGINIISLMTLEPFMIIHNFQFWRIITWVMIPPSMNILFALIMMYFYYSLGRVLEQNWGTFKFNVYIFGGLIISVIGAFVYYGIYSLINGGGVLGIGQYYSTSYVNMSIFLAFALSYPDMQVLLYFIIPIKMKWMAIVYGVLVTYELIVYPWGARIAIICSLLNFVIFFLSTRNLRRIDPREIHRRNEFKRATRPDPPVRGVVSRHKCAICGRTELTNPELTFRFCSKCNGNYEYCQDHLFTHVHKE